MMYYLIFGIVGRKSYTVHGAHFPCTYKSNLFIRGAINCMFIFGFDTSGAAPRRDLLLLYNVSQKNYSLKMYSQINISKYFKEIVIPVGS